MNKTKGFLLAASVALALAFTFSCHTDKGDSGGGGPGLATPTKTIFVDSRDSKTYNKVTIGTQTWMAENLNYAVEGSKCYGEDGVVKGTTLSDSEIQANCDEYGRLYNWSTAMNGAESSTANPSGVRGICPDGWHLPSQAEWEVMTAYIGGANTEGKKLKATSGWGSSNCVSGNGTDDYGFSALPGGDGRSDSSFANVGISGLWWSSSEYSNRDAYYRDMFCSYEDASWRSYYKSNLFSVRCVQD